MINTYCREKKEQVKLTNKTIDDKFYIICNVKEECTQTQCCFYTLKKELETKQDYPKKI
jgi:hypothetical protein